VNHGRVDLEAGSLLVFTGGAFSNASDGVFDARAGAIALGGGTFSNAGDFNKVTGGNLDLSSTGESFTGPVDIVGGTLSLLSGVYSNTFTVSGNATLSMGREGAATTALLTTDAVVAGAGTLAGVRGIGVVRGAVAVGAIVVNGPQAELRLVKFPPKTAGSLTISAGTLLVGAAVDLEVDTYTHTAGTLRVRIAGAFPGQYGSVRVSGLASLAGGPGVGLSAVFLDGYEPTLNAAFVLVTHGQRTGQYGAIDFPVLPPGLIADFDYLPGHIRMIIKA
jgi:hypothetical protein